MEDRDYQLHPETKPAPSKYTRRNVLLAALLTLTLVLGAFYAPLLWQSSSVAAAPSLQQPVALPDVPAASVTLQQDQEALAQLYNAISPSVVSIEVAGIPTAASFQIPGLPQDQQPQLPEMPGGQSDQLVPQGQGSGWIFDDAGHIVTNNHVVEGAQQVTVIFYDGTWAEAEVVATDPQADLAVLKVTPPDGFPWRPLELADVNGIKVGYSVIAIGNPFGLESTITTGIISALGRSFPVGGFGENRYTLPDVIQTDAAINPGNSGGPLVNLAGELVGVNFAIESGSGSNSGVGFAIPVSIVERVIPAMISEGRYDYPYLGLSGTSVTPTLARQLELNNTQLGAYVATVIPGGPADEAGIQGADPDTSLGGDLIVSFNGQDVRSFDNLVALLVTTTEPGDTATLGIVRDGEAMSLDITIGERPGNAETRTLGSEEGSTPQGEISARRAIEIAEAEVNGQLDGPIVSKMAMPDERGGQPVWVVELSNDNGTATVVIDQATGDVLEMVIE
jgi:2-alkenal reductase